MASVDRKRRRVLCISPAHPPHDPRLLKTIRTLTREYDVQALFPWTVGGLSVGALPFHSQLLTRLFLVHPRVLFYLFRQRPDIVHVFMPELLPMALLYGLLGARVVYEVQENLRVKFDRKPRNKHPLFRQAFDLMDQLARRYCYLVFTETSYRHTYPTLKHPFAVVHNFPDHSLFQPQPAGPEGPGNNGPELCYLGLISPDRGLDTMISLVHKLKSQYPAVRLHLFGRLGISQQALEAIPHYAAVRTNLCFHGHVDQRMALPVLTRCLAGLALLKPVGDYPDSYPTKLFEYMGLGLPVIASDFPLYRSIVDRHACGFCLNPDDTERISRKIRQLVECPRLVEQLSSNGRSAVQKLYNWQTEANKLLELYQNIVF